jgi:asparagine synthase (glutamine-hydrolysing)
MCGIVGAFDLAGSRVLPERLLVRMRDTLAHRGPDGAGALIGPGYALGHRRLAIVDLAGGAQPLLDEPGRALIANGEIYNHRALRERLEARGRRFRTRSDSEAILHAHGAWGDDATKELHGMFAYAWLDPARRRLVLARDRLGVKPLYWTQTDEWLLFASEPKALLAHPSVRASLDPAAVRSFLSFRYVLGSGTFFEGIHALEPGARLVATPGRVALSRYWELPAAP